jgi:hypothetical protein
VAAPISTERRLAELAAPIRDTESLRAQFFEATRQREMVP